MFTGNYTVMVMGDEFKSNGYHDSASDGFDYTTITVRVCTKDWGIRLIKANLSTIKLLLGGRGGHYCLKGIPLCCFVL